MSVIIKGAKMPQDCFECMCSRMVNNTRVTICGVASRAVYGDARPEWCPLEEVEEPRGKWITDRDPTETGVYLVTVLNREWIGKEIIQGAKPPKDEYWDDHANLYGQMPDDRWVQLTTRVWHDGIWSGYQETVMAWMPLPKPYKGE